MKKQIITSLALILSCSAIFCSCDDSSDNNNACSADRCKDNQTLLKCDTQNGTTTEEHCMYGCSNNTCVVIENDLCKQSVCKDSNTLNSCDTTTGKITEIPCKGGCLNNECVRTEDDRCTANTCKDQNTLVLCDVSTGLTTEKNCPNGCSVNACIGNAAENCKANKCKDETTLLECNTETGKTTEKTCENGCKDNACSEAPAEKCEASKCKDETTLLECNTETGKTTEKTCENGCKDNACSEAPAEKCTKSICKDETELLECDLKTGETIEQHCKNGCKDGTCVTNIGSACLTEEAAHCDGNALVYCNDSTGKGVWTKQDCPDNYVCAVYDEQPMCLEKCDKENEKGSNCGGDINFGVFEVESVCTKVGDSLFYIQNPLKSKECEYGCKDHHVCLERECVTSDEKCSGQSEMTMCNYGFLGTVMCPANKTCLYKTNGQTFCGPTCDPKNKKTKMCWKTDDGAHLGYAEVECRQGDDGFYGYYLVKGIEDCGSDECNDDTGCVKN